MARLWRSLDEWADAPETQELLLREFPDRASEWSDPIGRRKFLKLMAASLALAGLGGCRMEQPEEKIVPFVREPEDRVQGVPLFYATSMPLAGVATGLLVRSNDG